MLLCAFQTSQDTRPRGENSARAKKIRDEAQQILKSLPQSASAQDWDQVFRTSRSATVLAELFLMLHRQKRYNDSVEGLQSALRNNLAQPWMYDVLAVQMKLAGRPQKEVDRALLSRVDFAAGNEAQLMVSAALLARFQAYDQAMNLCREVVKRNPWQPSAWEFAALMADRTGRPQDVIWSRCGIIRHVWTEDANLKHETAATELQELAANLRAAGNEKMAHQVDAARQAALERDLVIRVRWAGDADLDLIVIAPDGSECSYRQRFSNHAVLTQTSDGGKTKKQHFEEFVASTAMQGDYQVKIRFVTGRVITGAAILEVVRHDQSSQKTRKISRLQLAGDDANAIVNVKDGRWQK